MTYTKEQLIERIAEQKKTTLSMLEVMPQLLQDALVSRAREAAEKDLQVLEIALAALTAEPVGYIDAEYAELLGSGHIESCSVYAEHGEGCVPVYTAPPAPVSVPAGYRLQPISEYDAMCAAMLQGAEPVSQPYTLPEVIDENLVEGLRLLQCMLDDYRERNYGHAHEWIRHIDRKFAEHSESHEDDAYSIFSSLLQGAEQPQSAQQNIPEIIPGGLVEAVNNLLNNDGSRGRYSAIGCGEAREKIELWLAQRQKWQSQRSENLCDGNSPAIPEGWKLVPVEPTKEMNKAGWTAMNEHDAINPTYRAMLAAAPQQEDE